MISKLQWDKETYGNVSKLGLSTAQWAGSILCDEEMKMWVLLLLVLDNGQKLFGGWNKQHSAMLEKNATWRS